MSPGRKYHALDGTDVSTPAVERHLPPFARAGLSPDGRLAAGDFVGGSAEIASAIIDPVTGRKITEVPGQQLLAWADDRRLIAWGIGGDGDEYHQRLVLVTIGSKKVQPLSGFRTPEQDSAGRWEPLFTTR